MWGSRGLLLCCCSLAWGNLVGSGTLEKGGQLLVSVAVEGTHRSFRCLSDSYLLNYGVVLPALAETWRVGH